MTNYYTKFIEKEAFIKMFYEDRLTYKDFKERYGWHESVVNKIRTAYDLPVRGKAYLKAKTVI